jgi:uncharacterized protein
MSLQFEWDAQKAKLNYEKHGVSFDEAKTVFNDPFSITISDSEHSADESRFIDIGDIGLSNHGRLLVVVYTEREESIRVISSRKASKREIQIYG